MMVYTKFGGETRANLSNSQAVSAGQERTTMQHMERVVTSTGTEIKLGEEGSWRPANQRMGDERRVSGKVVAIRKTNTGAVYVTVQRTEMFLADAGTPTYPTPDAYDNKGKKKPTAKPVVGGLTGRVLIIR